MLQHFISTLRQRPASIVLPKSFRHNTHKHKKHTKYLFPCVNALKYSGRPKSKLHLCLSSKQFIRRGFHTSNCRLRRQEEDDDDVPPVYYFQNPFTWMRNRMQFGRLRNTWDPEFSEEEFVRGAKQAVALITQALSRNDFASVERLTNPQAAAVLSVVSRLWKDEVKDNIALRPNDVRLAVPMRVFFNRLYSNTDKMCEIDAWFVGVKAIAKDTFFVVEMLARFNRDYAKEEGLSEWNVTIFQIRRFHVRRPIDN